MRFVRVMLMILLAVGVAGVCAADPADEYVRIYQAIQRADELLKRADVAGARAGYAEAKQDLDAFAARNPRWNSRVVEFRQSYLAQQLSALPVSPAAPNPTTSSAAPVADPSAADDAGVQLALLRDQLRHLSAENESLYGRLQEALAARPTAVDPQELARAEERIRSLEKENELLKVTLKKTESPGGESASRRKAEVEELQQSLARAREQLRKQAQQIETFEKERGKPEASRPRGETVTAAAKGSADALQRELTEQKAKSEVLLAEKRMLESHLAELATRQMAEIRARTEALERELTVARETARTRSAELDRSETARRELEERMTAQERANASLREELEVVRRSLAEARQGALQPEVVERLRSLEAERSALRQRVAALEAQVTSPAGRSNALLAVPARGAGSQSGAAAPPRRVAGSENGDAEAAALAAEAQAAAAAGRWSDAESAYRRALGRSGRDLSLLSGLGAALLAQGKLEEASAPLEAVVTARPGDPGAVRSLGVVRLRQQRNDEALMLLSRAAELDPQNPEVYCLLGNVMMRKGLSEPAELTLRRALELRPQYGEAHRTLAMVYALRLPPALDPGRKHYALAVAAGLEADPHLEKLLELDSAGAARVGRER